MILYINLFLQIKKVFHTLKAFVPMFPVLWWLLMDVG